MDLLLSGVDDPYTEKIVLVLCLAIPEETEKSPTSEASCEKNGNSISRV